MTHAEFFPAGSKITFVQGGYYGGLERKGNVTRVFTDNWGEWVEVQFIPDPEVECYQDDNALESFDAKNLRADIEQGRLEGSLKETRLERP